jgi:phytoene dehydrogenase-like protein
MSTSTQRYDAVVVGGGHNGLAAAAYLARAGRSVLVLERLNRVGGAAVSAQAFAGVDARLSRYSYLLSLMPHKIMRDLDLQLEVRTRRIAAYMPVGDGGLLLDGVDESKTRASIEAFTGDPAAWEAWQSFAAAVRGVAGRVFPTLTEPLRSGAEMRSAFGDDAMWEALTQQPLAEVLESTFSNEEIRGIVLTDALIGTFASAGEASLRQNRCFLYHVIGNGTGDWDVPVGGMGAVSDALASAASRAGAEVVTGATVTRIDPDGAVRYSLRGEDAERTVSAGHVLANVAPQTLARLLGEDTTDDTEGAQLKVNMLLSRLPRLRDASVDPVDAFTGTFRVNESYSQLEKAYTQAASGAIPDLPPSEIYCHSLTDPSILGPELRAAGAQTLTLFGVHMPAALFRADNDAARERALAATLASLNSVLAEPIEECLWRDEHGAPCIEAKTPLDLEGELGLPGGNIFHRELAWPFAESDAETGTWGVETDHPRVLLCGAGARRGGGVSGIPGHNAAMAILS